jgi:hypothetical protein
MNMLPATPIKGKYAFERFLGRGGMAEVFAGRTLGAAGFSRRVAIKRILPNFCLDDRFRSMFVTEAQLGACLDHANVVSILDFEEDESGTLFLMMELVDGVDLNELLRTGSLPPAVALYVASEVLQGLAYAHELPAGTGGPRGVVHRDISPHNVLLSWDGAVKVSDFGIAKARDATYASSSTRAKGKLGYLSPEYANGLDLDGRSDLFAAGVLLWEMLVGASLFSRASETATLMSLLFEPYPSPRTRQPRLSMDIDGVTMRLLEKNRDDRYADATAANVAVKDCTAYPKHGRALLAALLAERFPDRAPPRSGHPAIRLEPAGATETAAAMSAETAGGGGDGGGGERPVTGQPARAKGAEARAGGRPVTRAAVVGAVVLVGAMLATTMVLRSLSSSTSSTSAIAPPSEAPAPRPGSGGAAEATEPRPAPPAAAPPPASARAGSASAETTSVPRLATANEKPSPPSSPTPTSSRADTRAIDRKPPAPAPAPAPKIVPPPVKTPPSGIRVIDLRSSQIE